MNLTSVVKRRLNGLGMLVEWPRYDDRPYRAVDVVKAFADEWDHDMLNRAYLTRDVLAAVAEKATLPDGYAVDLRYRGRVFVTIYPVG